jgi:hypothetical protein
MNESLLSPATAGRAAGNARGMPSALSQQFHDFDDLERARAEPCGRISDGVLDPDDARESARSLTGGID